MFRLLESAKGELIEISLDGEVVSVPGGVSVAAALLYLGVVNFRQTPISQSHRAPFCMMGSCFECLVDIDGVPNQQACQEIVCPGMRVRCQQGIYDCEGVS